MKLGAKSTAPILAIVQMDLAPNCRNEESALPVLFRYSASMQLIYNINFTEYININISSKNIILNM